MAHSTHLLSLHIYLPSTPQLSSISTPVPSTHCQIVVSTTSGSLSLLVALPEPIQSNFLVLCALPVLINHLVLPGSLPSGSPPCLPTCLFAYLLSLHPGPPSTIASLPTAFVCHHPLSIPPLFPGTI